MAEVIRYIGKSTNPAKRLLAHICGAKRGAYNHHTARWIRKLLAAGQRPELHIIREVQPDERWQEVERECIAAALVDGPHLTNSTLGGEGLDYANEDDKQAYLANLAVAMRRYRETPKGRLELAKFLECSNDPEVVVRRREAIRLAYGDPAILDNIRRIIGEINRRPCVRAKRAAETKARWARDDGRAAFMAAFASDGTKAKQSERRIAAWADPVVGAKLRAIHASDEVRAKKAEGARRRSTPEYRAMMAEKTRLSWDARRASRR